MDIKNDNKFTFSSGFKETCESLLKTYDHSLSELHDVVIGKTIAPDEYSVCNSEYRFRYISPENIAEYSSNLVKALLHEMIFPNVSDVEKFSVESACRFVGENDCDPFKFGSIYETKQYTDADMNLSDLIAYCQNEFFVHVVLSKFEMDERRNLIKKDYNTMNGMHFSAATRRMIDAFPNLMNKTDFVNMDYTQRSVIETFIEGFILFAISLNITTAASMVLFCVPRSTYNSALLHHDGTVTSNSLLDDEYFKESVDETEYKPMYVILTDTKSAVSKPIKFITKSEVGHASISLDSSLKNALTFTMGDGFTHEDMTSERFKIMDAHIYCVFVSNKDYRKIKKYAKYLDKNESFTKYDWSGIKSILTKKDNDTSNDFKQICSGFVNNIFRVIDKEIVDKNTPTPEDLYKTMDLNKNEFREVFNGSLADFDAEKLDKETHKFGKLKRSKSISECFTECCLLKTNNILFKNKLPFNINMRNIVLEDMHPNFKDTATAVNFILHDNRSPFCQMIVKYGSYEVKNKINPEMIVRMFIGNPTRRFNNFSNYGEMFDKMDFHSDVNWLDKITYGDPYQSSNYRTDALGNDNKHPIVNTLTMLYKMYGDHNCKTNTELADNIEIVGEAMIGIIQIYKDCVIENWELVRDILAVFGEIMTKTMIRLYNNHMTIIVASDNMDDTMTPAYMYNEYFIITEDGENKPTVTVSTTKTGAKAAMAKGTKWLKSVGRKFVGWITDNLAKVPQKFVDVHKGEIDFVTKNTELNSNIENAIGNTFNPTVQNWPLYKVPIDKLQSAKDALDKTIKPYLDNTAQEKADITKIKQAFYSALDSEKLSNIQVSGHTGDQKGKNLSGEEKAIKNWILYSEINPTNTTTNTIDKNNWTDLVNNISQTPKAMNAMIESIRNNFKTALDDLNKRIDALPVTESFVDDVDNETFMEGDPPAIADAEKPTDQNASKPNTDKTTSDYKGPSEETLKTVLDAVQDLSRVFATNSINTMINTFYRTSYNLYRDMVTAYKQSNGEQQTQQQNQPQQKPEQQTTPAETPAETPKV